MELIHPLIDLMPFTIQFYDENFTVLALNDPSVKIFGYQSREDVIGKRLEELNPGFANSDRPAIYRKVLETGEAVTLKAVPLNREPPTFYGVHAFRYKPGILCICAFDVTLWVEDQRSHIRELEKKNAQLEQFAYVASHDLQEPLRTLTSFVDLLEDDKTSSLSTEGKEFVRFIRNATSRMQTLIRDLLEYSRVGRWQPREVDAALILEDVLLDLEAEIRSQGAVVSYDLLPKVWFDPTQLKQLFQNLLTNALKFRRPEQPARITVSCRPTKDGHEFAVKDEGIGIDPRYHEKIFVLFHRLHSRAKYEGSGIGLALCRRILDGAGGEIRVESTPGQGTTVYFKLLNRR